MRTMREVVEELSRLTANEKVLVATGVGSHQSIVARHFRFDWPDRVLLTSAGHGTMGSGLGYLVGASLEWPDHLQILITGDGSWDAGDCIAWKTVKSLGLPVKAFILDNGCFGIVRQFEELNGIPSVATVHSRVITEPRDLAKALQMKGSVLTRVQVADYGVWPILEGGHVLGDMTQEPGGMA